MSKGKAWPYGRLEVGGALRLRLEAEAGRRGDGETRRRGEKGEKRRAEDGRQTTEYKSN